MDNRHNEESDEQRANRKEREAMGLTEKSGAAYYSCVAAGKRPQHRWRKSEDTVISHYKCQESPCDATSRTGDRSDVGDEPGVQK